MSGRSGHLRRAPTQNRGRDRIEQILDAAAAIVDENGADALKVSEIARRAGVHLGTLYHFFASKDDIIGALAQRFAQRFGHVLDDILADTDATPDWATLMTRLFDAYAEHYRTEPALRELWIGARLDPQFIAADHDANNTRFAARLAQALQPAATVPPETLTLMIYMCWEATQALLETAFRNTPDGDPDMLAQAKVMAARYLAPAFIDE